MKRSCYILTLAERPSKLRRLSTRFLFQEGSLFIDLNIYCLLVLARSFHSEMYFYSMIKNLLNRLKNCSGYCADFTQPFFVRIIPCRLFKKDAEDPVYDIMQGKCTR